MKFQLDFNILRPSQPIAYPDKIMLIGSCFTEHMAHRLTQHYFELCSNPHGILFNPQSVASSISRYVSGKPYTTDDLFFFNELWHSWDHHSRFSDIDSEAALARINDSLISAHHFIKDTDWLMITLGSSFQYYLKEPYRAVANNHRAPSQWFEKKLLSIEEIVADLFGSLTNLLAINPQVKLLFTISPVRHIRDGVQENNRSKARLIEAVHRLCDLLPCAHYFPAYELVIDVLRDYRYYDVDLVHPNFAATSFVWEQFAHHYFDTHTQELMNDLFELNAAANHKPRFTQTQAHKDFCTKYANKTRKLSAEYPFLNLSALIAHFELGGSTLG